MVKIIRFLGSAILLLSDIIRVISLVLKISVFLSIVLAIMFGFTVAVMNILLPEIELMKTWQSIVIITICGGVFWLFYDNIRKDEKETKKQFRNYGY